MGEMNKVSCHQCKKSWEYRSGCGIMHNSLKAVAKVYDDAVAEELLQWADKNPFAIFQFAYVPAQCNHCMEIVEVPFLEIEGRCYIGGCPVCAHEVDRIMDNASLKCPSCLGNDLEWKIIGNWD